MTNRLEMITEVTNGKRIFYVVKDEHGYWGIEDKYFKDGVLQVQLNGITGKLSDCKERCIKQCLYEMQIDELVEQGMPRIEATIQVIMG